MGASRDLHYTIESITYLLSFVSRFALCVQNKHNQEGDRRQPKHNKTCLCLNYVKGGVEMFLYNLLILT